MLLFAELGLIGQLNGLFANNLINWVLLLLFLGYLWTVVTPALF